MIWSRKQLVGPRMAHDEVNPRMIELEVAKEILSEREDDLQSRVQSILK
jgi:hypothetical protein